MINFWKWKELDSETREKIISRSDIDITETIETVKPVIENVRVNRDKALIEYAKKFDNADISGMPLMVTEKEFEEAEKTLESPLKDAIAWSVENVRIFHRKQLPEAFTTFEVRPGIFAGEKTTPIDSAGLYVPRGRGSFPSMLYMLAVPAVEAGVRQVCVVTPPDRDGRIDPGCLFAAKLCGITEVYRAGGAQAIAALAYGTESIRPVAKVVGPGSIYVTAAKRVLYGKIDVGLPAGPSESVVLADASADPYRCALDLMIEAEHGSDSSALLVTDSENLALEVLKHLESIIEKIPEPRKTYLTDVFSGYGGIILAESMEAAAEIVNLYAPEHLQIASDMPETLSHSIRNAGEILLGQDTPFSIANYSTGPNAVLPTGGMARTYSPVSVRDFMKSTSRLRADKKGLESASAHVIALAEYEGFAAHAGALKMRREEN